MREAFIKQSCYEVLRFKILHILNMKKADRPIDGDDDKVDQREEENKSLVGRFCRFLLVLLLASSEPDIGEEDGKARIAATMKA